MLGETVGSYRIVGRLAEGGMGVVYVAEHTLIGRRVAVKMLLHDLSQRRDMVERFFNEAKASALVKHAGIVDVYDFGYHSSGAAFIVMELLEGESLAQRLRREGRLSVASALPIVRQVALVLDAAHRAGIVHRDLKPDNIFLVHDPEIAGGDRVKLLDFGIAKLAAHDGHSHTITGMVIGTPFYMSPEQCAGARDIDGRSDLYALGCVLFTMLTGQAPFVGEAGWVVGAHQHVHPPDVRTRAPDVPPTLAAMITRLLAKAPGDRFPDGATLAAQPVLRGSDTPADAAPHLAPTAPTALTPELAAPEPVTSHTTLSAADGAVVTPPATTRRHVITAGVVAAGLALGLVIALSRSGGGGAPPAPAAATLPSGEVPAAPALPAIGPMPSASAGVDAAQADADVEPGEEEPIAPGPDDAADPIVALEAALGAQRYDEARDIVARLQASTDGPLRESAEAVLKRRRRADIDAARRAIERAVSDGKCDAGRTRLESLRDAWIDVPASLDKLLAGCVPGGTALPKPSLPSPSLVALMEEGVNAAKVKRWSLALDRCLAVLRAKPSPVFTVEAADLCVRAACEMNGAEAVAKRHLKLLSGDRRRRAIEACRYRLE